MRLLVFLSAALVACCADVGTNNSAIVGGQPDTTTDGVVMLQIVGTDAYAVCTATVVSPHVLVTAAHCVDPAHEPAVGGTPTLRVFVGDDFAKQKPSDFHAVKTTATDPTYTFLGIGTKGHDVGIVVTSDALDGVAAIPYVRAPLDPSIVGGAVRLVGYGETVPNDYTTIAVRESATTTVATLSPNEVVTANVLPSGCHGDSGGATLMSVDGVDTLVSVISHGDTLDDCGGASYTERVDLESDFIDAFVNQYDPGFLPAPDAGADDGGDEASAEPPTASQGCSASPAAPHPAGALAWLLATSCVAARRRRRGRRGAFVVGPQAS
jgi:secreted trypsin-like serine protease